MIFLIFVAILCQPSPVDARGGGGGRGGGGRGRGGRTSASGYIQRGNPKWKPNPSQETRAFEWSKVTRFIGKIFGAGVVNSKSNTNPIPYKGYQGSYKPQNVYHPKKPRPGLIQSPAVKEKIQQKQAVKQPQQPADSHLLLHHQSNNQNTFYGRELNHKPLLYAAIFYKLGTMSNRDIHHLHHHYYDYSHVDKISSSSQSSTNASSTDNDTSIVLWKAQTLNDWMEEETTTFEPSHPLYLEDGLLKLPFYGYEFKNWIEGEEFFKHE